MQTLLLTYPTFFLVMADAESYPRGKCSVDIKHGDKALQCEGNCMQWFHCGCIFGFELTAAQYKKISLSEEEWRCANCCGDHSLALFNKIGAVDVYHFDFQKNMPTPKLTVGKQFCLRLLWTYLFGIYSASHEIMCALMWNELIAHRGANDVVSCLAHFIFTTQLGRTGAKWSIWWADNCPGQNKNHAVIWFFQDLIRRGIYSRIDYKFLVVGHTYGPTDRCFGVIEKHLNKYENVYTPQEWYEHEQQATSKVEVIEMHQEHFRNYWNHLHHMYVERNKDVNGHNIEFNKVAWFNFGIGEELINGNLQQKEHPLEVWIRYSHDLTETPKKVSFLKKSNLQLNLQDLPALLYDTYPLPIKPAKAADLRKLAAEYVPNAAKSIYMDLPTTHLGNTESDHDDK